jgi:hypothetical protein
VRRGTATASLRHPFGMGNLFGDVGKLAGFDSVHVRATLSTYLVPIELCHSEEGVAEHSKSGEIHPATGAGPV